MRLLEEFASAAPGSELSAFVRILSVAMKAALSKSRLKLKQHVMSARQILRTAPGEGYAHCLGSRICQKQPFSARNQRLLSAHVERFSPNRLTAIWVRIAPSFPRRYFL
jgi:hypothetical protein